MILHADHVSMPRRSGRIDLSFIATPSRLRLQSLTPFMLGSFGPHGLPIDAVGFIIRPAGRICDDVNGLVDIEAQPAQKVHLRAMCVFIYPALLGLPSKDSELAATGGLGHGASA